MRTLLLVLHLIGVAAWLGGNFTQMAVMPGLDRAGGVVAVAWHQASGRMAQIYYSVAGTVVFLTGVGLVLDGPYEFSHAFVSIGFAVVIIGGVMGVAFFAPTSRAAVAAHEHGDASAIGKVRQRFAIGAAIDTALVIFTVYAMVAKLGV
ncbi:MAG: hypothetical protein R2710_24975 [Acidimicrobiales bacterium]